MSKIFLLITFFSLVQSHAADNFQSYEDIIGDLSAQTGTSYSPPVTSSNIESTRIHAGVGPIISRLNLKLPGGLPDAQSLTGAEAILGIDLLTPRWRAEGGVRSFNTERFAGTDISLKEFDLRLVHQLPLAAKADIRWGFGMAARYLSLGSDLGRGLPRDHTTPASLIVVGFQTRFNHLVGLTAEVNYRNHLTDDTVDRSSLDGAIRVTGSF